MGVRYLAYLRLEELLALQEPVSEGPEHDELLFIISHQVSELWFKQMLHELRLLQLAMENGHAPIVVRTLRRLRTIVATLTAQIDVLETMSPVSFPSLRQRIETAGGVQSVQFRELEFVLGRRRRAIVEAMEEGSPGRMRLERLLGRPSLYDSLLRYLSLLGHPIPREVLDRDLALPPQSSPAVQESLIEIYRHDPGAWQICELMVDLDRDIRAWRYRHAVMVERTLGAAAHRVPASDRTESLRSAADAPLFPDLWEVRGSM